MATFFSFSVKRTQSHFQANHPFQFYDYCLKSDTFKRSIWKCDANRVATVFEFRNSNSEACAHLPNAPVTWITTNINLNCQKRRNFHMKWAYDWMNELTYIQSCVFFIVYQYVVLCVRESNLSCIVKLVSLVSNSKLNCNFQCKIKYFQTRNYVESIKNSNSKIIVATQSTIHRVHWRQYWCRKNHISQSFQKVRWCSSLHRARREMA